MTKLSFELFTLVITKLVVASIPFSERNSYFFILRTISTIQEQYHNDFT